MAPIPVDLIEFLADGLLPSDRVRGLAKVLGRNCASRHSRIKFAHQPDPSLRIRS